MNVGMLKSPFLETARTLYYNADTVSVKAHHVDKQDHVVSSAAADMAIVPNCLEKSNVRVFR